MNVIPVLTERTVTDAVFISDLHLHPADHQIFKRFQRFVQWAARHVKTVYVLGDLLHAWPGDDAHDAWSQAIAARFAWLHQQGITLYYLHGNRDFLLGSRFLAQACLQQMTELAVIWCRYEGEVDYPLLLAHGDHWCTHDRRHQVWRRLTRNRWFVPLFLSLPLTWRQALVQRVRQYSRGQRPADSGQIMQSGVATRASLIRRSLTLLYKRLHVGFSLLSSDKPNRYAIDVKALLQQARQAKVSTVIHGHIHQPGLMRHETVEQYVLSDWDDNPRLLCYHYTKGFYFKTLN